MRISRNRLSALCSLQQKKHRDEMGLFLVEGEKSVREVLASGLEAEVLVAESRWLENLGDWKAKEVWEAETSDMERLSSFKTPSPVAAAIRIPAEAPWDDSLVTQKLCLALDSIQDPGNLGTILRLADWFGIRDVFCSPQTVDVYNPKTIQASMGSFLRVRCRTTDLPSLASRVGTQGSFVWGTFLRGENLYQTTLQNQGLLVFGNEGSGIGPALETLVTRRLTIPSYPPSGSTESLNVALAAAIVCAEFRRQAVL